MTPRRPQTEAAWVELVAQLAADLDAERELVRWLRNLVALSRYARTERLPPLRVVRPRAIPPPPPGPPIVHPLQMREEHRLRVRP